MKKILILMLLGALSTPTQKLAASKTTAAGLGFTSLGLLGAALEAEIYHLSPEQREAMGLDDSTSITENPVLALKNAAHNRARLFKQVYHNMRLNGLKKTLRDFPYLFGGVSLATLSAGAATYQAFKPEAPHGTDAVEQARLPLEAKQPADAQRLAQQVEAERIQRAERERLTNLAAVQNQHDYNLGDLFGDYDKDDAPNAQVLKGNIRPLPETPPQKEERLRLEAEHRQREETQTPSSSSSSSSSPFDSRDVSESFITTSPAEELDALLRNEITATASKAFHIEVNKRRQLIKNSYDSHVIDARAATDKARDKFILFNQSMTASEDNYIRDICYIAGYRAAAHNDNSIRAAEEAMNVTFKILYDTNKARIEAKKYNEYYQEALQEGAQAAATYTEQLHAYARAKPAFKAQIKEQAKKLAVANEIATAVTQSYLETARQTNPVEVLLAGINAENIFAAAFTTAVKDIENQNSSDEVLIEHATDVGIAAIHNPDDSALHSFVATSESLLMASGSTTGLAPSSSSSSSSSQATPPPLAPPPISQHLKRMTEAQPKAAPLNLQDAITHKARTLKKVDLSTDRSSAAAAPSSEPRNAFDAMFGAMQQRKISDDPSASLSLTGGQSLLVSSIMLSINPFGAPSSEASGMNWQAIDRLGDNQIIPSFLHKTLLDLRDDLVTNNQRFTEVHYGTNKDLPISQNVGIFVKKIINIVGMQAYALHPSVEYINARVQEVVTYILSDHEDLFKGYNPAAQNSHELILVAIAQRYNEKTKQQQDLTPIYQMSKTDFEALQPSSSSSSATTARRDEQLAQGAQDLAIRLQAISAAANRNDSDSEDDDWSDDE